MLFNFLGINPIDALFWTAVLNAFLAPPLLVLVMLVANDRTIMGPNQRPKTERRRLGHNDRDVRCSHWSRGDVGPMTVIQRATSWAR
jgi:Mn2+/Fe2+ NRAMP family transporter